MDIAIGDQNSLEWIKLVISSLVTVAAVFLGAWAAFRFEVNRDSRKNNREYVSAINRTIFSFGAAANKLLMIRMQTIDPIRNHPLYFLEMRPLLEEELETVTSIVFDDMDFLLETEHRNLLMELFVEQEKITTIFAVLKQRSKLHYFEMQPKLSQTGILHASTIDLTTTEKLLGNRLFNMMKELTDDAISRIDETIESHKKAIEDIHKAAKQLYPKTTFIKFVFYDKLENDQEAESEDV